MKKLKKWVMSVIGVALVWQMFRVVGCAGAAYADPAVAGDWRAAVSPAALADSAVTWLLAALVLLKVLEMWLAWLAPRTATKLDDEALAAIHRGRELAEEIVSILKPPPTPPGPFPAIVSGTIENKDGAS